MKSSRLKLLLVFLFPWIGTSLSELHIIIDTRVVKIAADCRNAHSCILACLCETAILLQSIVLMKHCVNALSGA